MPEEEKSIFARHALPNVPLEELVQLFVAVGAFHSTLTHLKREDPLVCRMLGEIKEEYNRRMGPLLERMASED